MDSRIEPTAAVEEAAEGRDPADVIESVFRSEYGRLVALARLLLDRQVEAEEVVQEAFARVLSKRSHGSSQAEATAYVQRAVINVCRDGLRRRRVARAVGDPEPWRSGVDSADAAAVAVAASERRAVIAAIRTLPIRQREVVVLRYLAERSTAETAEVLGISEGSVKTHLSRGLSALEAVLETRP